MLTLAAALAAFAGSFAGTVTGAVLTTRVLAYLMDVTKKE